MSFDSIYQLDEARKGYLNCDGHPPAMAELWRWVEYVIAGPLGMLVIQSTAFLVGVYLLFARRMSARTAAVVAVLVLWFPPISGLMAVIWKDSQMSGFLMLGLGLVTSDSRRTRLWGIAAFLMATLMRHNALLMTGPLIFFSFAWSPQHRWWQRYSIAVAAWLAITLTAQVITGALTDKKTYIWTDSLARSAISRRRCAIPTPRSPTPSSRRSSAPAFASDRRTTCTRSRDRVVPDASYVETLWDTAYGMFAIPASQAERDAVTRAWKAIVFGHLGPVPAVPRAGLRPRVAARRLRRQLADLQLLVRRRAEPVLQHAARRPRRRAEQAPGQCCAARFTCSAARRCSA